MNWKNAQSRATSTRTIANVPTSCCEIETSPICQVSFGNGLGKALISADQIRLASPLKVSTRPIVMITTVRTEAFETGAITTRWMPSPSTNAKTSVPTKAGQYDQPWFSISVQAM